MKVYLKWRSTHLNLFLCYFVYRFSSFFNEIKAFLNLKFSLIFFFSTEFLSHQAVEAVTFLAEAYHPHHVLCATTWHQIFLHRLIWKMATVNILHTQKTPYTNIHPYSFDMANLLFLKYKFLFCSSSWLYLQNRETALFFCFCFYCRRYIPILICFFWIEWLDWPVILHLCI